MTIADFRSGSLTIDSYSWVTRCYNPRELSTISPMLNPRYLYTMEPIRRTITLHDEEDDDPIVLIKRRVF